MKFAESPRFQNSTQASFADQGTLKRCEILFLLFKIATKAIDLGLLSVHDHLAIEAGHGAIA